MSESEGRCAKSHLFSFPVNQRELEIFIVDGLVGPALVERKANLTMTQSYFSLRSIKDGRKAGPCFEIVSASLKVHGWSRKSSIHL